MPPPPAPYPLAVTRFEVISAALHTVIINVFLMMLVFMETAANRGDNDTLPAAPPGAATGRPVVRLWIYGELFLFYLAVKVFQLRMPSYWYPFNQYMDELSLVLGVLSLIALVGSITYDFLLYGILPELTLIIVLRVWLGDQFYEGLYQSSIRIYKSVAFLGKSFVLMWVYVRTYIPVVLAYIPVVLAYIPASLGYTPVADQPLPDQPLQAPINNAQDAIRVSLAYWNRELLFANTRRAAAAQVAREIAEDAMAAHRAELTMTQALIDAREAVGYIPRPAPQPAAAQPAPQPHLLDVPALQA